MLYPCSEIKGADQLRSYCEADLRLCFRLCRLFVFPYSGLKRIIILQMQRFLDFETFSFTLNGEIIEGPRVEVLEIRHLEVSNRHFINEPPRRKTNNVVSEQVRHKPACTSTEKS